LSIKKVLDSNTISALMQNLHWICLSLAVLLLTVTIVQASNKSMLMNEPNNCSYAETGVKYFFKNAEVREVVYSESCPDGIGGNTIFPVIYLNANMSGLSKSMLLRHEYCHWLHNTVSGNDNSFWQEIECNLNELNPLNYV
jgi:hypothetical protein